MALAVVALVAEAVGELDDQSMAGGAVRRHPQTARLLQHRQVEYESQAMAAHQQAAVAVERLAFRAHQAQAMRCHPGNDAIDTGASRSAGHCLIIGDPIAIQRRVGRVATQRVAHHDIGDPLLCRRSASARLENHGNRRETALTVRLQSRDAMRLQQSQELVCRKARMAE